MEINKVAIIGAGPAGISSAIQLKRFGIDPIVFESDQIGGLLHNANLVENYPGFPDGISGEKLCMLFIEQFNKCNTNIINEEVITLDYIDNEFMPLTSFSSPVFMGNIIKGFNTLGENYEYLKLETS